MIYKNQKNNVQNVENTIIDAEANQQCSPIIDADAYIDAEAKQAIMSESINQQCAPIIVASEIIDADFNIIVAPETCMPIIDAPDITVEQFVMRFLKA